jgi:hypothetical protein
MTVTTITLQDVALAIYIGKNGEILGSESINGSREVANNTLLDPPRRGEETEILQVEVSVETKSPSRDGCCGNTLKLTMRRTCYDKFGRPYIC